MTESLLYTSCLCDGPTAPAMPLLAKDGRTVVRCLACGLVRTLERAADYETLYTDGDRYHVERPGHIPYRERFDHDRKIGAMRLAALASRVKWLDVGCANGGFMAAAKEAGYDVSGLELNPAMAAWASRETGCVVYTAWDQIREYYDIISYHDVFEHVADPRGELNVVHMRLNHRGLLIIDVPDITDAAAPRHGMESHHVKPLEHLYFYTERHLGRLLQPNFEWPQFDRPIPGKLVAYARRKP